MAVTCCYIVQIYQKAHHTLTTTHAMISIFYPFLQHSIKHTFFYISISTNHIPFFTLKMTPNIDYERVNCYFQVYSTNKQVPDSGSTATAMLTGVKTKSKLLGLDNSATVGICRNITTARVSTMLEWAQKAGRSTDHVLKLVVCQ